MEVVTIDIITYALCRKAAAGAVSGVSGMRVEGTNLIITTNDGQELIMTFPTPERGISVTDLDINKNGELICILSDGNVINAGKIPTAPIPVASTTTLGGIKVGKNLVIEEDGTLSALSTGEGGTADYNALVNLPTLNGVEISGDKTAEDYGITSGDKTYIYVQSMGVTEWNIQHGLNKFPSVSIVDDDMMMVIADVQYIDENNITIKFTKTFIGKAFLN